MDITNKTAEDAQKFADSIADAVKAKRLHLEQQIVDSRQRERDIQEFKDKTVENIEAMCKALIGTISQGIDTLCADEANIRLACQEQMDAMAGVSERQKAEPEDTGKSNVQALPGKGKSAAA